MKRREFIKYGMAGMATLALGGVQVPLPFQNSEAFAAVKNLNLTFTDAMKRMVTHTTAAPVECYFWCFKSSNLALPSIPGPNIFVKFGDTINLTLTNNLGQPHRFAIPSAGITGPTLNPGDSGVPFSFPAPAPGTYLYYDDLNAPVNRMMGLHGALVVMPLAPALGSKFTPYNNPTANVQKLFNDLGGPITKLPYPGLDWQTGDLANGTPPFRQWIWLLHEANAVLNQAVGSLPAGQIFPAADFIRRFNIGPDKPKFFTMSGQSGWFAHDDMTITPHGRVGEPGVIRILNAGLHVHSLHIHANHVYLLSENHVVKNNLWWVDTYTAHSLDEIDWLVPFHRPPDVPNTGGIGRTDPPLPTASGTTWPPLEELNTEFVILGVGGRTVRQSPLAYPMHDHLEPSQTANGGNYNLGLMAGIVFTGDRVLGTVPGVIPFDFPE